MEGGPDQKTSQQNDWNTPLHGYGSLKNFEGYTGSYVRSDRGIFSYNTPRLQGELMDPRSPNTCPRSTASSYHPTFLVSFSTPDYDFSPRVSHLRAIIARCGFITPTTPVPTCSPFSSDRLVTSLPCDLLFLHREMSWYPLLDLSSATISRFECGR